MTRPADSADHPDEGALREVQDAYRALPPAEPGAALDARVRAAVAADLAGARVADDTAPAATARVIEFPWWRRASMPLAAAATLMLAVGLGRMWFVEGMSERAPDSPYLAPATVQEAAPAADAPAAPAAAEPRVSNAQPQGAKPSTAPKPHIADVPPAAKAAPQKSDSAVAEEAVIFRGLERAAPPPPAEAEAKRDAAPQADSARRERSAESLNAAPAPAPAVAPAVKPAASEAPAAKAMQKRAVSADMAAPADAETFDEIRRLLRDQHRDDARALLKRWRDAHPGVTLPEDLRALAAELDRAP
ncbi:hypothetical protein [Niveibacterium sp.]|uniref:hypothetical protein n=1 Tax=Niveibacterium sp. TaxID=2017444 RepID=UPI0035B10845